MFVQAGCKIKSFALTPITEILQAEKKKKILNPLDSSTGMINTVLKCVKIKRAVTRYKMQSKHSKWETHMLHIYYRHLYAQYIYTQYTLYIF